MIFEVLKVRRPGRKMSGFWTVRILKILRTSGPDVMSGRALNNIQVKVIIYHNIFMKIIFVRGPNSFSFHPSVPKSNCIFFLISGTELHQTKAALEVLENQARECERNNVEQQDQIAKLTMELQNLKKPSVNSLEV